MNKLILILCALLLPSSLAQARLYDPTTDGQCLSQQTARDAWPSKHLRYHPQRDGGKCWYAGTPIKKVAKRKVKAKPRVLAQPKRPMPFFYWNGASPPGLDQEMYAFYEAIFGPEIALRMDFEARWRQLR